MVADIKNRMLLLNKDGNPGGLNVIMECYQKAGDASLTKLEALKVCSKYIYMGYADICKKNADSFLAKLEDPAAFRDEIMALPEIQWEISQRKK